MATSQKKTTAARTRSKRTGSSGAGAGKKGRKAEELAATPPRRGAGAVICLLLGIFAAFGYFNIKAVFIDLFCNFLKGLLGYGFWLSTPMLLLAAYVLAFHRGRPVKLRVWCALLFPLDVGVLTHIFMAPGVYELNWGIWKLLWNDGLAMTSGGALGGVLAVAFVKAFSKPGAAIIFVILGFLLLITAFNRTITDLVDAIKNMKLKRETDDEEEEYEQPVPVSKITVEREGRVLHDIPLDEVPPVGKAREPEREAGKRSFFEKRSAVMRPDEVLAGQVQPPAVPEPPAVQEPPAPPEIVREPAVQKLKRVETAQATEEVARDIKTTLDQGPPSYQYPPVSLLHENMDVATGDALGELRLNQERLAETIRSFGIEARITGVVRGPSVTRYEVELDQGVRLNKLTNLADDIALSLGASGVRIAPIPDKISMVGVEVPNKLVSPVGIREVVSSTTFTGHASKVAFAVGKDIGGNVIVGNISKLPHLLIAGTTGSGKSVCTNSLIISLLYKATPEEVRLIMVDPKMVELGIYNGIPHLLIPGGTDPKKAAGALQWAVTEMMKRYRTFAEANVRDLMSYNSLAAKTEGMDTIPRVVIVIDELADLMLVAAKEVEESVCRVAQMGRAAGMHLIIATQRPSADVITGLMKANIPSRIAFAVASAMESRIILDTMGAEKLVGRGDMLWYPLGAGKPLRVQGTLISDEEVAAVVSFVKKAGTADYDEDVISEIEQRVEEKEKNSKGVGGSAPSGADESCDELLPAAVEVVLETGMASVSMLQRRLKLGYSRAARLVDQMEEKGIVGPFEGSKPRQVLISKEQWREQQFKKGMPNIAPDGGLMPDEPPPGSEDDG
jgi:S-DNA-T family DNA segregation ATPase FtsK/SpoIIIE